jgi:FkbM family methyltransferase
VQRRSVLLYPLRRRLPRPENRLKLRTGETLASPVGEPLLALFEEIWIRRSYLPAAWAPAPGPTVVDVGANVGVFSVWAARQLGAARVVAVEPSPRSAGALLANLERNGIENAIVLQVAVGGERRQATLYRRGPEVLDTLFQRDNYGSRFEPTGSVRVLTLDDLFTILDIQRCDLLKLDCEGAEYEVLFGASRDSLSRIRHIAAEYHIGLTDYGPELLQRFLEERDFAVTVFGLRDAEGGHLHASRRT